MTHCRRIMLEELQRRNFSPDDDSQLSLRGGAVRPPLQVSARPAQSHAPAELPGVSLADGAAAAEDRPAPRLGAAVLLREDACGGAISSTTRRIRRRPSVCRRS